MENIILSGRYAGKQRRMKRLLLFGAAIILMVALSGCQARQSPLVGSWHTESGDTLPLESMTIEFKDDGVVNTHEYHVFGVRDYYGYGPSGTYGTTDNKLTFTFSGGSSRYSEEKYADKNYLEVGENYPDRLERYFEIDGDTLYLYETPDKKETPDVFLTGAFKRGSISDCDQFRKYFAYE